MARLARRVPAPADTDRYSLAYLRSHWEELPEIARQWEAMEEHERLDFVLEWPIREDRLAQLEAWVADGSLTPEETERYKELEGLVRLHAPILERLLAEPDAPVNGTAPA